MVEPLTIARVVIRLEVAVLYKYKEKEDTEPKQTISKTNTDFDNPNKTTNNDFIKADCNPENIVTSNHGKKQPRGKANEEDSKKARKLRK